ncbi:REP-associated tyrosine transposase [Bordetella petrii]|uniref:REP-associated tyrosine transposase n=1 Tax=Bordetella petrii TaxID=94624 RepID=UPI001E5CFFAA|nr:transposase [Bordetella petrii]MCD0503258.1 transposase [Bordetella petrii]
MPRSPRILIAHQPHHIIQRGHRRQVVFEYASEYRAYLAEMHDYALQLNIALHAWCLMPNHVHLLLTPGDDPSTISTLMKHVARGATRRFNARKQTMGTIWETRFKCWVIDQDRYFLECCRYIELNPVRARLVRSADAYPWSSHRERIGVVPRCKLVLHPLYLEMGQDEAARRKAYCAFLESALC